MTVLLLMAGPCFYMARDQWRRARHEPQPGDGMPRIGYLFSLVWLLSGLAFAFLAIIFPNR
jgi:hypothetical protein